MSLLEIFCDVDDFMNIFDEWLKTHVLTHKPSTRGRKASLSMSEVMTILIWFHQSHYRDFKALVVSQLSAGNSKQTSVAGISQKNLRKSQIWLIRSKNDPFLARLRLPGPCSAPHFSPEAGEKRRKGRTYAANAAPG
jgi:hypothetical protein